MNPPVACQDLEPCPEGGVPEPVCGSSPPRLGPLAAAAIALMATVLVTLRMWVAAANDLWLDELWTFRQVAPLRAPYEVFTHIREENHALYTLWAYVVGPKSPEWVYRLPAVLAGVLTVPAAAWIGLHHTGRRDGALFSALLVGFSYFSLHFGSEARGYAPAVFFSLAALAVLLHDIDRPGLRAPLLFAGLLILGLVAQPLAVNLLVAAAVWVPLHRLRHTRRLLRSALDAAKWLLLPGGFFVVYYLTYLRRLRSGGGAELPIADVLRNALAYSTGLPIDLPPWVVILTVALLVLTAFAYLAWRRDDSWVLYLVGILLAPGLILYVRGSTLVYERYFVLNTTLILILISVLISGVAARGFRWLVGALLSAYLIGNGLHAVPLFVHGRGSPAEIVRRMCKDEPTATSIRYSADHAFRVGMLIDFYAPKVAPDTKLEMVKETERPRWSVVHRLPEEPNAFEARRGPYRLMWSAPSAPMSGFQLGLYRRGR